MFKPLVLALTLAVIGSFAVLHGGPVATDNTAVTTLVDGVIIESEVPLGALDSPYAHAFDVGVNTHVVAFSTLSAPVTDLVGSSSGYSVVMSGLNKNNDLINVVNVSTGNYSNLKLVGIRYAVRTINTPVTNLVT